MQSTPTTKKVLQKARALIAKKGGWTQREFARGRSGRPVDYVSRSAVCFCLDGALMRATHDTDRYGDAKQAVIAVIPSMHGIVGWNDRPRRTQAQVVRLLDRAIAKAALSLTQA